MVITNRPATANKSHQDRRGSPVLRCKHLTNHTGKVTGLLLKTAQKKHGMSFDIRRYVYCTSPTSKLK